MNYKLKLILLAMLATIPLQASYFTTNGSTEISVEKSGSVIAAASKKSKPRT